MARNKDGVVLDEDSISTSLVARYASEIFESAGNGNLEQVEQSVFLYSSAVSQSDSGNKVHLESKASFSGDDPSSPNSLRFSHLRDKKSSTPLHYAAGNGHIKVCRFLLEIVFREAEKISRKCNSGSGHAETKNGIAAASSYADTPNQTQGRTALHWAARNGHLLVCKLLVEEYRANPDPLAKGDVTPLQLAVWRGHVDVCLWLSETGSANKHFMNGWGCTVHHWLGKSPIYAEEKQQEQQHQDQNPRAQNEIDANCGGIDSISRASAIGAEAKLLTLCKWLDEDDDCDNSDMLSTNGTISAWNRPNDHGQTPLHKAGFGGNMPVLKFLIEKNGICDTQRDSQHNTAADCAERNRQWEVAKYLRRHGNPMCLQKASAVLFPEAKEPPRAPSLLDIRAAYIRLARLYHPDRSVENHNDNEDKTPDKSTLQDNRWKDLQEAYRLWTLWWKDPDEADAMIRGLERHHFLQRQLPLMILWHEEWHERKSQEIQNTSNNSYCSTGQRGGGDKSESKARSRTGKTNHDDKGAMSLSKKQKVGRDNLNTRHSTAMRQQFSDEAIQKLEDFERKLVRLLGTLPSHEIVLSQLPKEYEKTWGGSTNNDTNAMIRPKEYRCRKLRLLLEKYCSRTVKLVEKPRVDASGEGKAGAILLWVQLKDS